MDPNNDNWPQPPLGGGMPAAGPPGSGPPGAGPLGDWQHDRDPGDDDAGGSKKSRKKRGKKQRSAEESSTRAVANKRRILAVGLAILAGGLLWMGSGETGDPDTWVARTAKPMAALTGLTPDMVEAVALPAQALEDGAFTGATADEAVQALLDAHAGDLVRYPLPRWAQVRSDHFLLEDQLAVDLGPDERLISLDASIARAVGGNLRVGDMVDIIGVDDNSQIVSVVATSIEIVDIALPEDSYWQIVTSQSEEANRDRPSSELLPGDPIPGTYTLRVKSADVPRIYVVAANAELFLSYRSPGAETPVTGPLSLAAVLCGLDRPGLTGPELDAMPEGCRDADGNVPYTGTPATPGQDVFLPDNGDAGDGDQLEDGTEG